MINKKINTIILSFFFFILCLSGASAKINIAVDRTYEITSDFEMKIKEVHTITNNTENLYVPAYENIQFTILGFRIDDPDIKNILEESVDSATIKENGILIDFEEKIEDSTAFLSFRYGEDFMSGDKREFVFEYTHPALVYQNGVLLDAYIHAFSEDFPFSSKTNDSVYKTKLKVPKSINKEVNFINPIPDSVEEEEYYTLYEFTQESLVDQFVWIQLGTSQNYNFKIVQDVFPTEDKVTGLKNRFDLVLPKNFDGTEIKQEVFFSMLKPEPKSVFRDEEGNLIAEYEFFTHEQQQIVIEGYAVVERIKGIDYESDVLGISNIEDYYINRYTKPAEFWEVDEEEIQVKAKELKGTEDNVFKITENIYNFVVDSIDYSQVKRFGLNERQGALKTLNGGAAVCMEYADLFLSLMRANKIPTRAVFGYGYDPRVSSEEQEAHQWVQVYMPGLDNWVDVDVTWGESGDLLIGGDLNHFYTHVAYEDPNTPSMISRFAYGSSSELRPPKFEIETVENILEDKGDLLDEQDIVSKYLKEEVSDFEFYSNQIKDRIVAGFSSLGNGLDLSNGSQIIALGIVGGALLVLILGAKGLFGGRRD